MSNGEIMVTNIANKASSSAAAADDQEQNEFDPSAATSNTNQAATTTTSAKNMASLNFAQRRHEASWRLASHQRAVANVAALAAASSSGGGGLTGGAAGPAGIGATLGQTTSVSTKALQHARKAWVSADVAQDSLFFSHANLFPSRAPPHDVYGACDTMIGRTKQARHGEGDTDEEQGLSPSHPIPPPGWYDLPSDLRLVTDRYDSSKEKQLSTEQVATEWHMAVRRKLLLGEVGWMKQKQLQLQQQVQQHELPLLTSSGVSDASMAVEVPWKVSLRGGIVRLTYGVPKITPSKTIYPIEAVLTVLSPTTNTDIQNNDDDDDVKSSTKTKSKNDLLTKIKTKATLESEWTLVNVDVHVQAKTGQSNHQLDTTNKQRYNLHKMCSLAMSREEARARKLQLQHDNKNKQAEADGMNTQEYCLPPARPLHAVFQVAQYFSLSWQLEILSSQALTLRKGLWAGPASESTTSSSKGGSSSAKGKSSKNDGSSTSTSSSSTLLNVTPVQFFENRSIIGIMSISFWSVDDRYGPPALGDLDVDQSSESDDKHHNHNHNHSHNDATTIETKSTSGDTSISTVSRSLTEPPVSNQLTLSIRAEPSHHHGSGGIRVSLSGGGSVMEFAQSDDGDDEDTESSSLASFHVRETIKELLDATSNPFHLSASEALLAATKLCAERKCNAVVEVLPQYLPSWIVLKVERGSILVAAKAHYDTSKDSNRSTVVPDDDSRPVVLFRLACDTRTGSFISTFSRSTQMLQYLACNDIRAGSDTTLLRAAAQAASKKKSSSSSSTFTAGRAVRDAFDSLIRSMNVLSQRVGVGIDTWKDQDDMSALLRRRSIQSASADVKVSLMTCCGMAALYGMAATAVGVATGVQPAADIAGGKIEPNEIDQFQQQQQRNQMTAAASPASSDSKSGLIPTPPLGVFIDQKIVEENIPGNIDSRLKQSHASQAIFGMFCSVDETNGLTIHPANITVRFISPSSPVLPTRTNLSWTKFASVAQNGTDKHDETTTTQEPSTKRLKTIDRNGGAPPTSADKIIDLMVEVERFATIISKTVFSS
eukprot:CAMPEP_0113491232 /NCGR_PEP_ID=MMETSP0014_2-20120614/27452_1 /TAXON_ID=2857 /ORGANISM="Nitzschia sp." /LENGTH=1050 /DNA_ID=CAMNT_0000385021 /DNA_START=51 /DNA_END=3203 /DNA_ORIENTATION=+ /assembly_acc=CAM_ASM_000159